MSPVHADGVALCSQQHAIQAALAQVVVCRRATAAAAAWRPALGRAPAVRASQSRATAAARCSACARRSPPRCCSPAGQDGGDHVVRLERPAPRRREARLVGLDPDICRPGAQAREISAMLELATLASLGYKCGAIRAQLFRRNPGATPFRRSSPPRRRYTLEPLSASLVLPISAATIATCHNYFQNFPPSARADAVHECVPFPRRLEVLGTLTQPGIKRDKNDGCLYDGGATACATTDRMLFPLTYLVHPAQDGGKDCRRLLARLRERQAASRMNWLIKDPNMHHGRGKQLLGRDGDRQGVRPAAAPAGAGVQRPPAPRARPQVSLAHVRPGGVGPPPRPLRRPPQPGQPDPRVHAVQAQRHERGERAHQHGQQQGLPGFSYDELFMLPEELFSYELACVSRTRRRAHAAQRRRSPPAPPSTGTSTRARAFRASTRRSRRGCSARRPRRTGGCGRGSRRRRRGRRRRCRRWRTARSSRCGRPTGSSRPTSISS